MLAPLFERLGGPDEVKAIVDEFDKRTLADDMLAPFLASVNKTTELKMHQLEFLRMALDPHEHTKAAALVKEHYTQLVGRLNELHFNAILQHFCATMEFFKVAPELVEEACCAIRPLRTVFEQRGKASDEQGAAVKIGEKETEPAEATPARAGPIKKFKPRERRTFKPRERPTTKRETLFTKLGGVKVVKAVVEEMYSLLLTDPLTNRFFKDVNLTHLKQHQVEFMKIAFTQIPDDLDVVSFLVEKHMLLFRKRGLNAEHFDRVAEHFVGACVRRKIPQELIDEAVAIVGPLRPVFEQGAAKYGKQAVAGLAAE